MPGPQRWGGLARQVRVSLPSAGCWKLQQPADGPFPLPNMLPMARNREAGVSLGSENRLLSFQLWTLFGLLWRLGAGGCRPGSMMEEQVQRQPPRVLARCPVSNFSIGWMGRRSGGSVAWCPGVKWSEYSLSGPGGDGSGIRLTLRRALAATAAQCWSR